MTAIYHHSKEAPKLRMGLSKANLPLLLRLALLSPLIPKLIVESEDHRIELFSIVSLAVGSQVVIDRADR